MNRDKFACKLCKDSETTLHIHHKTYIEGNDPWEYSNNALVTLCEHCHREISKPDFDGIPFDEINAYKSTGWESKSKILFLSTRGTCSMVIYDKYNTYTIGFNFEESLEIKAIIKMLKRV